MQRLFSVACLIASIVAVANVAKTQPSTLRAQKTQAGQVRRQLDIAAEPSLAVKVRLHVTAVPLSDALRSLTEKSGVRLRVGSAALRHQRVTVQADDVPLATVLQRLALLLSHDAPSPTCQWEKETSAGAIIYVLVENSSAARWERQAKDKPRRDALKYLLRLRDMQPATGLNTVALSGLSNAQLEALVDGEIMVRPITPALKAAWYADYDRRIAYLRSEGDTREFAPFRLTATEATVAVVGPATNGAGPAQITKTYCLSVLSGRLTPDTEVSGGSLITGPAQRPSAATVEKRLKDAIGISDGAALPVYDLDPLLKADGVTDAQRADLSFNLAILSKVTGVNLYHEAFPAHNPVSSGGIVAGPNTLRQTKGTLPQLLAQMSVTWDYEVKPVGKDFLIWSPTWADLRGADIPEWVLAPWRAKAKRSPLTADDYANLARTLNYAQMSLTLPNALPDVPSVDWQTYAGLRFWSTLSLTEREATSREEGMPASRLSAGAKTELRTTYFGTNLPHAYPIYQTLPPDGLTRARIKIFGLDAGEPPRLPLVSVLFDLPAGS